MNAKKALLDAVLYPQNLDVGADTIVQVVVVAGAVAEDLGDLLAGARACVNVAHVASLVASAGGRLGLTPALARTCLDADDARVQALAHRAIDEAVGDEAEIHAEEIRAAEGALILVVGVLMYEAATDGVGAERTS